MAETTTPAPAGNVYSEAQHFSLVKSAVDQETASLTTAKAELEARVENLDSEKAAAATELSEAKNRIDLLEAEKASAEQAAETARTELESFKSEIARKEQITALKDDRKAKVQTANEALAADFFTDERVMRWAEMSDEAFDAFVADMTEMAKASKPSAAATTTTEAARESAAFAGGTTPTANQGVSTLASLLGAGRRGAVA